MGNDDRSAHLGFYLIDEGLPILQKAAGVRGWIPRSFRESIARVPLLAYVGAISLLTAGFAAWLLEAVDSVIHRTGRWL